MDILEAAIAIIDEDDFDDENWKVNGNDEETNEEVGLHTSLQATVEDQDDVDLVPSSTSSVSSNSNKKKNKKKKMPKQ